MTAGPGALRLCAPYEQLSREDCAIPERCVERSCSICKRGVHYDPKASIPVLGPETIVCTICMEAAQP